MRRTAFVAIYVTLVLVLQAGYVAVGQEVVVPRHPPTLVQDPVQPVATIIADRYDIAYLARIGYVQAQYVARLTGGEFSQANKVASVLNHVYNSLIKGDWKATWTSLNMLRDIVTNMSPNQLQFLATSNSINLPACSRLVVNDQGVPTKIYIIENRYNESNPAALCLSPTDTLRLNSALDTVLSVLSMLHNKTVAPEAYILVLVHVPPEAAYPQVIQAILEGRLGTQVLEVAAGQNENITALVEALIQQVETGTKEEALAALRQLLELARSGVIDWNVYAQALRTYQDRFGEPPQLTGPPPGQGQEEVSVDLNNLLRQMQDVVEAAEKARIEARAGEGGGVITLPTNIRITQPDPAVMVLAGLALAATLIYREKDRLIPETTLHRVLLGIPPKDAGARWCYRALVDVLRVKGLAKEPWETPGEYLARIRGTLDPHVEVLAEELTAAFEKTVYAEEEVGLDARDCTRRLREVLLRWRAREGGLQ